jgi:F-type H+-transporting ATPase subunit b
MQIDWWTLGLQTINFLVVVWLLSRFLYRPVRRLIEEREAADRKASEDARAKAEAAEKTRQAYEQKLADFAKRQQQEEAELQSAMEAERDEALKEARDKAAKLLEDSREKADRERAETLRGLKAEITALARTLAQTALSGAVLPEEVLQGAGDYLKSLPEQELTDLKSDVAALQEPVTVVTAQALDDDLSKAWMTMLSECITETIDVAFAHDNNLLGGAKLHFPHAILDLSVAGRLEDAVERMSV